MLLTSTTLYGPRGVRAALGAAALSLAALVAAAGSAAQADETTAASQKIPAPGVPPEQLKTISPILSARPSEWMTGGTAVALQTSALEG